MIQNQDYDDSEDENQPLIINLQPDLTVSRYPSSQYYENRSQQMISTPYSPRRMPVHYGSHLGCNDDISATLSRYKYYNKLAPHHDTKLVMPDHVVPDSFLVSIFIPSRQQTSQNSLITIFAMWNTMVGTSLLSMPWGLQQAGFATGIGVVILVACLMFYTSYRIVKSVDDLDINSYIIEFSDVCRYYLGKWAEVVSLIFSLSTLVGAAIVYWILITNFLYHSVTFIYVHVSGDVTPRHHYTNTTSAEVYCPSGHSSQPPANMSNFTTPTSPPHLALFWDVWDLQRTVPFFLIAVLLPLVNFKSPTFFMKFNSLGTASVVFLVAFVTVKAVKWGINLDLWDRGSTLYLTEFRVTFPSMSGISALALFIHNCVLAILRHQKNPQHNIRDLALAYIFVTATYLYIGITFYVTFPIEKSCIADNFLNNILSTDILAFTARLFLVLQLVAVYPLLLYIIRVQLLNTLFGSTYPSWKHVVLLNLIIIVICALFARFLPHIGKIIGFVGALAGFAYAMLLPCLVYIVSLYQKGLLSWLPIAIHATIILFGFLNFVAQFVLLGVPNH